MHNLIYLSSAKELFSEQQLIDLLTLARRNNAALDVTGLLLYHEGSFLQVLEGDQRTIQSLFQKISLDVRHKNLLKVIDSPVQQRSFKDWSMGFKQVSGGDWSTLEGYLGFRDGEDLRRKTTVESDYIVTMIKSFGYVNNLL